MSATIASNRGVSASCEPGAVSHVASQLLIDVEQRRQTVSSELSAKHRASLGQFFTPAPAAGFLADLLELPAAGPFRLLDPGAGVGSLSAAVAARVMSERPGLALHITAFEIDPQLTPHLTATLAECAAAAKRCGTALTYEVRESSFVEYATGWLLEQPQQFDAVIANPPYKKVATAAPERRAAEACGLRASNLYTIFTGLAADLLASNGQMSVIIPRSWANGPYHEPFRRFLLDRISIDFLHVYEKRGDVFADAEVLQENVVFHGVRGRQEQVVTLSISEGGTDERVERIVSVDEVVHPGDPHMFVRIPVDEHATRVAEVIAERPATLSDIGVSVSTGRVVDFRARDYLRADPQVGTVPLIYPGHLLDAAVTWPTPGSKKPNALERCDATEALMLPNEPYVLVKRFSAKEESRRVVAAVVRPGQLPGDVVAYENHLNVYHCQGRGLPLSLALGLGAYLNSTIVDEFVRSFSGHTQINATDLRQLRYPTRDQLEQFGDVLIDLEWPDQERLDELVAQHLGVAADAPAMLEAA